MLCCVSVCPYITGLPYKYEGVISVGDRGIKTTKTKRAGTGHYRLQGLRVGYTEISGYILRPGVPYLRGPPSSTVWAPFSLSQNSTHPQHTAAQTPNITQHARTMSSSLGDPRGPHSWLTTSSQIVSQSRIVTCHKP